MTQLNLGEIYRLDGQLDDAFQCFVQSMQLSDSIGEHSLYGYSLGNLGMIHAAKKNFPLARQQLQEAIRVIHELQDPYAGSVYQMALADVYFSEQRTGESIRTLTQALKLAQSSGLKEQMRNIYYLFADIYAASGNYAEALKCQRLYQLYQDSLVNRSNIQKIEQLKAGHEINKREQEISHLNDLNTQSKTLSITLGTSLGIILIMFGSLYTAHKKIQIKNHQLSAQKKEISLQEKEKSLLLDELNHRVKNNLQMVTSLLALQSRSQNSEMAKEALLKGKSQVEALALVHRLLYQDESSTRINMQQYIEELVSNIKTGYDHSVKLVLDIQSLVLKVDQAIPVALVINELTTNSFKHAFHQVEDPELAINLSLVKKNLILQVKDNGSGFSGSFEKGSFGINLIRSLIDQLEGVIHEDGYSPTGTIWRISFPLK